MCLQTGIVLGISIFVFFAITNTFLAWNLMSVSTELKVDSFAGLAGVGFSFGGTIINFLCMLDLIGVILANFIIVGDMANSILPNYSKSLVRSLAITCGALVILPALFKRNFSQLRWVAVLSFSSLVLFVFLLVLKAIQSS